MNKATTVSSNKSQKVKHLIAVIDDEHDLLDLYEMLLTPLGEVQVFSSPEEFIERMNTDKGFKPDVIITDYNMPNMNGVKMIQTIHRPDAPIASILLSGYLDKDKSIAACNAGIGNILEKPVVKSDLVLLTKELLLEARSKKIQEEMSDVMKKLKEMFLWFRMLCMNELDLKSMHQQGVVSADKGPEDQAHSLEESLQELEDKLTQLAEDKIQLDREVQQLNKRRGRAA
ncbi:response regulator [Bdellovibrio sp. HCB337]|uniref:response regulator n=1 Tax=Bdellovibrio sp. HCB337 TaxID=3394358 RepID=UPI0039A6D792